MRRSAMPANLSPEYRAAKAVFRKRPSARRAIRASAANGLLETLRTIPKYEGTDHLQADVKRRIKELSADLDGPRKGGSVEWTGRDARFPTRNWLLHAEKSRLLYAER